MKVLKKQGLTLFLIAALIVTLTLGIVFMMPARTASAEEEFKPDATVGTEAELTGAVSGAQAGVETKIQLTQDIALNAGLTVDGSRNIVLDLNGHKLSHANYSWIVFCQVGTKLTLIDTKGGGAIANDMQWAGQPLIYNYGTLITSVDITVPAKDQNNSFTGGNNPAIKSISDSVNFATNNWTKPSVTVLGGTLTGPTQGAIINLIDSNLTVTGGTFVPNANPSSGTSIQRIFSVKTLTINAKGSTTVEAAIEAVKADLDAYKDYRGSTVKVTGGDFTAFTPEHGDMEIDSKIYVGYTPYSTLPNYFVDGDTGETTDTITVSLEKGESRWGKDLSAYTPEGQWMELYDPSIDEGHGAEKYYIVSDASEETAGAAVTVGQSTRYYRDFASAWGAIGTTTADRTLKLCNDVTVEQLDFSKMSGNITLDLNGKKLMIKRSNSMSNGHVNFGSRYNSGDKDISLTVKDGANGGELILSTPSGGAINTNSFFSIGSHAKFTLESGTIRQTGYFPADRKEATKLDEIAAQAIFHLGPGVEANNVVTIKGGNIISDIYYGTEQDHGELTSSPYLVSWYVDTFEYELNFEMGEKYSNKTEIFKFDLTESINAGKTSAFSWNFNDDGAGAAQWEALGETFNAFTFSGYGKDYLVSNFTEKDNFLGSDGEAYGTLNEAVEGKTGSNYSITVLRDKLTIDENVTLDGITLDLDRNRNFTLVLGEGVTLTLTNGATLCNGTIQGAVKADGNAIIQNLTVTDGITVAGNVTMRDVTVTGNITVAGNVTMCDVIVTGKVDADASITVQSGSLTIASGEYNCTFSVADGSKLNITGGSFRGSEVEQLSKCFAMPYYPYNDNGAEYDNNTLYPVKIAPNPDAQEWYNRYKDGKFEIASTDEWNYFAIYVSTGLDSFEGKTVTLIDNLDFGYRPSVNGASAASEPLTFLPAGTQGIPHHSYGFRGTFDGNGKTIQGINVTEINAGLFGRTDGSAKISNITVANSVFTGGRGVGYFDEYNTEKGWVFAGGVIAQGYHGNNVDNPAKNITVQNVTIAQAPNSGNIMAGGYIGQTWNDLCLEDINIDKVTLQGNWKMGGIVGFTEASVTIKNGSVTELDTSGCSSNYVGSVMGQLVGRSLTLDSCDVDAPNDYLVGGMDAGNADKEFKIQGVGTDIAAKGSTKMTNSFLHGAHNSGLELTVPTTEEESEQEGGFSVNFGEEEIPSDAYKNDDGEVVVAMVYSNGNIVRYETLEEALKGAKEGDTVVLNSDVEESVTISTGMGITLDLGGHILTGTITVEGALTLENGTVKGTVTNNGKLVLELSEDQTLTIEGSGDDGKAIEGTYEVGENVCKTSDDGHKIEFVYGHGETIYSADGNVITLTCDVCHQVLGTVTLVAPENVTYSGEKIEATVDVSEGLDLDETLTITYKNEAGEEVQEIISVGTYTASITLGGVTASVTFTVKQMELVISDIQGTITYSGEGEPTIEVSSYTLKDLAGNVVQLDGVTVTVTLQKSKYNVGKQVALITAINMTGNSNYALAVAGNEAFIELDVAAANLIVRVNRDGSVSYEGFVNGENESVLEGELHLEWVDNGDGTSTVTPSGLTSANYVITFESGIVENEQSSNALWITLAVVGGVIAALGAVAVVYAFRRKKN